ncbi:hypothetical protein ONZ45_g759 [Pleurotus djamor]|nr:hypothetical protein ONZ45_g759 [Pleurotus djamor]
MDVPSYSEEQLLSFYDDLLAIPSENPDLAVPAREPSPEEDIHTVDLIDVRLMEAAARRDSTGLLAVLQQNALSKEKETKYGPSDLPYQRALWRIESFLNRAESVNGSQSSLPVAPGIVTSAEVQALVRVCLREKQYAAAEHSLSLAKRLGLVIPEAASNSVLDAYAKRGLVTDAERFLTSVLTTAPTEIQRHLHIKAHLRAYPSDGIPESALTVLHHYEDQKLPAPMTTYSMIITSLFDKKSVLARAQAWDIFSHMRYVAHPQPDAFLYTMMIRACASPFASHRSEAERALDLWTEMTVDHEIPPTTGAYNAVILACARTGEAAYVNEAFRLAKQMLDTYRDASGASEFKPTAKTFSALLEGAKRIGDLGRARWILAEMVRVSDPANDVLITEEVIMHMFHTYATYTPPFRRGMALMQSSVNTPPTTSESSPTEVLPLESVSEGGTPQLSASEDQTSSFSHLAPQSRAEIIREAQSLFHRAVQSRPYDPSLLPSFDDKFSKVKLTPRLINSYLSIYYRHGTLKAAKDLYESLFEEHRVRRDARTCVEALNRCSNAPTHERLLALEFATSVWEQWMALEGEMRHRSVVGAEVLDGRIVERARVCMIRILARTGRLDDALSHVRSFVDSYPPPHIRDPRPTLPMRGTRTVLFARRPLVRTTTPVEVPDDTVPPLLTFGDLDVLHHRLAAAKRVKDVGYVKWVCKAYEGALRTRRERSLAATPEKSP